MTLAKLRKSIPRYQFPAMAPRTNVVDLQRYRWEREQLREGDAQSSLERYIIIHRAIIHRTSLTAAGVTRRVRKGLVGGVLAAPWPQRARPA